MAGPYYVRSTDGSNADSGLTWALAKATLAGALAVAAAGERIWVSQAHAETQATAMTLTSAGTAGSPVEILCGNDAAQPPTALATTATVSTTGASNLTFGGCAISDGISYSVGSGANFTTLQGAHQSTKQWDFYNGGFTMGGTAGFDIYAGPIGAQNSAPQRWVNWTLTLNSVAGGSGIYPGGPWEWLGGALAGSSLPSILFHTITYEHADVLVRGVDLSVLGAGYALVNTARLGGVYRFEQCKLGASVSVNSGTTSNFSEPVVLLDNCDSADTQYRMQRHSYEGDVHSETTIVRTGGASDGTTALSHKMVPNVTTYYQPLYGPELVIWNNTTGSSRTLTVEVIHDGVNLKNNEIWLQVEYLGTAGTPQSLFVNNRSTNILSTPADHATSSAVWTTTGLSVPCKQQLIVTFTPQEIGLVRCRVAADLNSSVYVDPFLTIS